MNTDMSFGDIFLIVVFCVVGLGLIVFLAREYSFSASITPKREPVQEEKSRKKKSEEKNRITMIGEVLAVIEEENGLHNVILSFPKPHGSNSWLTGKSQNITVFRGREICFRKDMPPPEAGERIQVSLYFRYNNCHTDDYERIIFVRSWTSIGKKPKQT